jgi:hypothetical protein
VNPKAIALAQIIASLVMGQVSSKPSVGIVIALK